MSINNIYPSREGRERKGEKREGKGGEREGEKRKGGKEGERGEGRKGEKRGGGRICLLKVKGRSLKNCASHRGVHTWIGVVFN